MSLLPEATELPGDAWQLLDERTWRTGQTGNPAEWAKRARDQGSVTAWRSFEQKGANRWLWVQVTPVASAEDALSALRDIPKVFLKNSRAEVRIVEEHEADTVALPGSESAWAYEQLTTGPHGEGTARYVAGTKASVVVVAAGSGFGEAWPWEALAPVAQIVLNRITDGEPD